jgi:hypothetical protein
MGAFVDRLGTGDVHDRLVRALEGRGAFRRFKDLLFEHPEVQTQWREFHDRQDEFKNLARLQRIEHKAQIVVDQARAIGWLTNTRTTYPGLEEATVDLADATEPIAVSDPRILVLGLATPQPDTSYPTLSSWE